MKNSAFVDFSSPAELMHHNRNKSVDKDKPSFEPSSSMLKNKESDRIFYPSKVILKVQFLTNFWNSYYCLL